MVLGEFPSKLICHFVLLRFYLVSLSRLYVEYLSKAQQQLLLSKLLIRNFSQVSLILLEVVFVFNIRII